MKEKYQVLIIGGGTAGIMVASQLKKEKSGLEIAIIEPAETHYYQPAWTLVGANTYKFEDTARPMKDLIPSGVDWVKDFAEDMDPDNKTVSTRGGAKISYDYLVVCPGLVMDPSLVKGLPEALDKGVVCSNYTDPKHTWEVLKNFKGGTALFTQPTTPIKCGGAPQKIMYLAEEAFKKTGVRSKTNIIFATPGTVIFGVKQIKETLMCVVNKKKITLNFGYKLVEIDAEKKIAWYEMADHESYHNTNDNIEIIEDGNRKGIRYDMVHLAPPQAAPDFVKKSKLSNDAGWLTVDTETMQHIDYRDIFGLGDVAALPTAKTGAAIRKQVPIVVHNILELMAHDKLTEERYNGYSSCPLVTGYGKMVLAEFDYDNNFTPDPKLKRMLVFDSSKEHWRLWMLKKHILPYLYWNKMMKGENV
jgi:sulfide:quinone oxidoreductase